MGDEGEDDGRPRMKSTPSDWHRRDKNQRWTKANLMGGPSDDYGWGPDIRQFDAIYPWDDKEKLEKEKQEYLKQWHKERGH